MNLQQKFLQASKDILEKNLQILEEPYCNNPVVLVYDTESLLAIELTNGYKENLKNIEKSEMINIADIDKKVLQEKLLALPQDSTVVLIQSTNFRIDDFRIRLNLHNAGVGCLEHPHLSYMPHDQIENYADSIQYYTDYYLRVGNILQEKIEAADEMLFHMKDGNILTTSGGFEEVKKNTGDYTGTRRGGNFPVGEVFTETKDFSRVNGKLSIYAYPDEKFQVQFLDEPFIIDIQESLVTCTDPKCPPKFRELLDQIAESEDGVVYMRELGFGLNPGIGKEKMLSDIGAFERQQGFHVSLGKKHGVYRKKFHRKITQRFHIDIFPDIEKISIDGEVVFEGGEYCL